VRLLDGPFRDAMLRTEKYLHELESDRSHEMKGYATRSGSLNGRSWRDAASGGRFEHRMKILTNVPMKLWRTYWGSDGGCLFDILTDGKRIATQNLNNNRPGEFFDVVYDIPSELIREKTSDSHPFYRPSGKYCRRRIRSGNG